MNAAVWLGPRACAGGSGSYISSIGDVTFGLEFFHTEERNLMPREDESLAHNQISRLSNQNSNPAQLLSLCISTFSVTCKGDGESGMVWGATWGLDYIGLGHD